MQFAHGDFRWTSAQGIGADIVISGLAFQPKAIRFYSMGHDAASDTATQTRHGRRCIGFATSTSNVRCVASYDQDAAGTMICGSELRTDCVVMMLLAGNIKLLSLASINSDGFTLNVEQAVGASEGTTVFWEAWGGDDIANAECGDFAEPSATGNVDYTLSGSFQPDVVMFAGVQSTAAAGTEQAESSGFYVGFASGTADANNVVATGAQDHSSTTADTDGYAREAECLAQIALAGGNPTARAKMTLWNSNGFRLNWIARATTGRKSIFLAIKGGAWAAGSYTINGNSGSATATVSGLSFAPIGVCGIGALRIQSTAGTSTTQDILMLGTGTSTSSRRSLGYRSEDSTASSASEVNHVIEFDQYLAAPSDAGALLSAYDINAMNSDGFQVIVDTAGGVASEWQGYLAFGTGAVTGTGALTAQAATVDGEGVSSSTGTGSPDAQSATVAGTGVSSSTGTGALTAQAAVVDGEGTVGDAGVTGTGALVAQAAAVAGSGVSLSTGSGTPDAQSATVTGAGVSSSTGAGTLTAQAATVAGAGVSASAGTGALVAQSSTLSGTGTTASVGSGALVAQSAQVDGAGISSSTGSGALVAQEADVNGAGASTSTGSGALTAQAAQVDGAGVSSSTGSGALIASAATVDGSGTVGNVIVGSGALVAQSSTVTGAGVSSSLGTGALSAASATVAGSGNVSGGVITGSGALFAQSATTSGSGVSWSTGVGTLAAAASVVLGIGISMSTGTGALSAQPATVSGYESAPLFPRRHAVVGAGLGSRVGGAGTHTGSYRAGTRG